MGWEDVPSLQNCTWVSEDFPFGIYCTIPPSSCLYRSPPAGKVKMRVRAVRSHVSQVESIRLVGEQPVCKPPAHSHNGSPSIFVFLLFGVYCPPAFCCQDCTSFMSIEEFRRKVNRENSTFSSQSVTVSGGSLLRQKTYLYHWLLSHNSLKTFLLLQFLTLTVWRQLAVGQIRICKFSSTQNICTDLLHPDEQMYASPLKLIVPRNASVTGPSEGQKSQNNKTDTETTDMMFTKTPVLIVASIGLHRPTEDSLYQHTPADNTRFPCLEIPWCVLRTSMLHSHWVTSA